MFICWRESLAWQSSCWAKPRRGASLRRSREGTRGYGAKPLIQMKLAVLAVVGRDPADRTGDRAHDHRLRGDHLAAEPHAFEKRAIGHPGGREQTIAPDHVANVILL